MYIVIINLLCFCFAFFSKCKKRKLAFKTYLLFLLLEYILFLSDLFTFSFTEFYSIIAIECFILSLFILKIYGFRKAIPFYIYNMVLSFTYLYNIYSVVVLDNLWLWKFIYNKQEIIGFISVLLLIDLRVIYNEFRKHFINFSSNQFFSNGKNFVTNMEMDKRSQ